MPWSSTWSLSFWLSHQNLVHFPPLSHACHMSRPPHSLVLGIKRWKAGCNLSSAWRINLYFKHSAQETEYQKGPWRLLQNYWKYSLKNKTIHWNKVIQKSDFAYFTDIFTQRRYLKTKLHQTYQFTEQLRDIVHNHVSCISREQQCLNQNLLKGVGNVSEPKGNIYNSPIQLAVHGPHPACKMLPTGLTMVFNLG
jgi:hypothetical protein